MCTKLAVFTRLLIYLLHLNFHSLAVVHVLVQTKQIGINIHERSNKTQSTNSTKHNKYKYSYHQNTQTVVKTSTHYKTHRYTHQNITKPTHTQNRILQNKLKHASHKLKTSHANNTCDLQEVRIVLIPTTVIYITIYM